MTDTFLFDVFLSHNKADKPRVRRLAERLKAKGMRVWYDEWIVKPGDDIYLAVEQGLQATRILVLCMSQDALGSGWVGLERSTVLFRDPSNAGRRFIPLLLVDCELPDTLRRYKYVDYRKETNAAFAELLAACRGADQQGVKDPAVPPEKPKGVIPGLLDSVLRTRRKGKTLATPSKSPEDKGRKIPAPANERVPAEPLAVLERTLTGHKDQGWINSVAVSPDGKWAASASDDKTVKVWDLEAGHCEATLSGHAESVNCVAFARNGKLFSASNDSTVRIWEPHVGRLVATKQFKQGSCLSLALIQDGQAILTSRAAQESDLELWDSDSLKSIWSFRSSEDEVLRCVAVSKDSKRVVGGLGTNLYLFDHRTGECLATLRGHSAILHSTQVTADGRHAMSSGKDKIVNIWDLEQRNLFATLEGHGDTVFSIALSPNEDLIASAGFVDHTVRLWDWKSGTCLQVVKSKASAISIAFSPDGSRLVVGTTEGVINVYRLTERYTARPAEKTRRYVNAKVVLIGESTVGKTTLAHRLIEDRYVKTESTHGMNIWRLDLPLESDDTIEREALLWDLAGQEDYRLIHQLYLEESALALLLINPQKDDPFSEAGDWLKALRSTITANTVSISD
jgi:WD40 repeat protein